MENLHVWWVKSSINGHVQSQTIKLAEGVQAEIAYVLFRLQILPSPYMFCFFMDDIQISWQHHDINTSMKYSLFVEGYPIFCTRIFADVNQCHSVLGKNTIQSDWFYHVLSPFFPVMSACRNILKDILNKPSGIRTHHPPGMPHFCRGCIFWWEVTIILLWMYSMIFHEIPTSILDVPWFSVFCEVG